MSLHPSNSTALAPSAPRDGGAPLFHPWQSVDRWRSLSPFEDDSWNLQEAVIAELEFIIAPREHVSPRQSMPAAAPPPSTVIEVTTQMPDARPSQHETFSPIHLQRTGVQDAPVASSAMAQPEMRYIAGTPLNSPPSGAHLQRLLPNGFSYSEDLSSPGGNHPPLNLPSPEFDSIHQVMRIPPPGPMVPTLPGQPVPSMLGNLLELPRASDAEEFQADIPMPRHMPALSLTFDITALATPLRTTTTTSSTPQSAPPALERLPAVPAPTAFAPGQDDHLFRLALAQEHTTVTALVHEGLGQLPDRAAGGLEIARQFLFNVYRDYQRNPQTSAAAAGGDDTSSDDEAAQLVGNSPDPHAM